MVFFMTAYYLIKENKRGNWRWLGFIFVLFGLGTLNICFNLHFNQMAWVDKRNFPGGPLAFLLTQQNVPINIAGNAISAVIPFLADGLLVSHLTISWCNNHTQAIGLDLPCSRRLEQMVHDRRSCPCMACSFRLVTKFIS